MISDGDWNGGTINKLGFRLNIDVDTIDQC